MRDVCFVQTGDWHLGQPYGTLTQSIGDRLREERLEAVSRVLRLAQEVRAAFVLAAGDQFDRPNPHPDCLARLLDRIGAYPDIPVHMIPGNHDPLRPASVYTWPRFEARPANLHFHSRIGPVRLSEHEVSLFPCPCLAKHGANPLDWIPRRGADDGWRIALAHGSLPYVGAEDGTSFPIPADAPERYDLDYVALGDWHTPTPDPASHPGQPMYYAGTPEIGGWDETRGGSALVVTLRQGKPPDVTVERTGKYRWLRGERQLSGPGCVEDLLRWLSSIDEPANLLLRLRLWGAIGAEEVARLEGFLADFSQRALYYEAEESGLRVVGREGEFAALDSRLAECRARLEAGFEDPQILRGEAWPPELGAIDRAMVKRAWELFRSYAL
jgi:DNA repair exonuclease SbcCD nuclease subunit